MKLRYDPKTQSLARRHYVVGGYTFDEIADMDDMPCSRTLRRWALDEDWASMCPSLTAIQAATKRYVLLVEKEDKTDKDYKELDFLTRSINSFNAVPASEKRHTQASDNTESTGGSAQEGQTKHGKKKRKKRIKNDVSSITKEMLDELKDKLLYPHQNDFFDTQEHRTRFLLKPRQIGATFYFSFEAFYDAVINHRNKIFISASRDQAEIFKANIIALCREHFEIELSGSPLQLNNNGKTTTLYFKSTNARTAQSASGDLYVDEVFWIPKFKELRSLAQAMATHQQYKITYFSTPSVTSHEAYDLWCGKWFRKTMACNDPEFDVDVTHDNLKHGKLCDDGIYRQMLTIDQVVDSGFDRINIEQLQAEYSKEEYGNLFLCKFIDDAHSAFSLKELMKCQGDKRKWGDFDPDWPRPFAMKPVVIGFDPARTMDKATVVVLSCPVNNSEKFRLLESHDLSGNDFEAMAKFIEELTKKYYVVHIGVDTTGIGYGVYELIQKFFPMAMSIHYNPTIKNKLVIKALNVISKCRFEYDQDAMHIAASFMNIRKKITGDGITYATNRTASTGHADIAWAIMHAMIHEDLAGDNEALQTSIGFAA